MQISKVDVKISIDDIHLNGILQIPEEANSIVLFAHGSGSGRFSKRNQYVATILNKAKIATLLFDLLTESEESVDEFTHEYRFNIELLASRLIVVTEWLSQQPKTKDFLVGYFGASNKKAMEQMHCIKKIEIVPGATHLFEEPGTLEEVARLAKEWFIHYLN